MPPSAELEAAEEMADALVPGKGEGDRGIVAAEIVVGSKAGDDEDEMDCFRTDLKASDVEAAMLLICQVAHSERTRGRRPSACWMQSDVTARPVIQCCAPRSNECADPTVLIPFNCLRVEWSDQV